MNYSIDFDVFKEIAKCRKVSEIQFRLSSSGLGFHFRWQCRKKRCKHCLGIVERLDDPKRLELDNGPRGQRRKLFVCGDPRLLWDRKAGRKAGDWTTISIIRQRSATRPRSRRTATRLIGHIAQLSDWQNP